jgi:hypothetical protein
MRYGNLGIDVQDGVSRLWGWGNERDVYGEIVGDGSRI